MPDAVLPEWTKAYRIINSACMGSADRQQCRDATQQFRDKLLHHQLPLDLLIKVLANGRPDSKSQ